MSLQDSEIIFKHEKAVTGLGNLARLREWINAIAKKEKHQIERIAYFFVSDEELLKINREYLGQDDLTDILTFPYSYNPISADIYISYDRVADNSSTHNCPQEEELRRVIIHGVLHMCGWTDKTKADSLAMRQREDECLSMWEASKGA